MEKIFIALTGPEIKQRNIFNVIIKNYECWNLNKLSLKDFIINIKKRIHPINNNVLSNYELKKDDKSNLLGIHKEQYKKCS